MESGMKITKQLLKCRSGEFDVESIHTLILREQDINDLGCIGECGVLERLDLSRNDVTKLYSLAGLTNLMYLNLSANRISSLEGLQSLDNLENLNLAGNLIGSVTSLNCLTGLESLKELRLQDSIHGLSNPVCMNVSYKREVTQLLPNITILDGERLSGRGSDLFKLCNDLDRMLEGQNDDFCVPDFSSSGPWIPEDSLTLGSVEFEKSCLSDAEQQLQAMLAQCHQMSTDADEKLAGAFRSQPTALT